MFSIIAAMQIFIYIKKVMLGSFIDVEKPTLIPNNEIIDKRWQRILFTYIAKLEQ